MHAGLAALRLSAGLATGPACMYMPSRQTARAQRRAEVRRGPEVAKRPGTGAARGMSSSVHGKSMQQPRHGLLGQPSRSMVIAVGSESMSMLKIIGGGSAVDSLNSTSSEWRGAQQMRHMQLERSLAKKMCWPVKPS